MFVPADTELDDLDVRIEVAGLALPAGAVVGGWAAARLHEARAGGDGLTVFDGRLPGPWRAANETLPILVTGSGTMRVSAVEGLCVFRSVVPEERDTIGGVPVTTAARTAVDLARLWPLVPAVIALDRLLQREVVDAAAVQALLAANDPDVATPLGRDAWRRRLVRAYRRARHPGRAPGTWKLRDLDLRTDWSEKATKAPKWSDLAPPHSSVRTGG